jgi:hypothetical protein
MFGKLLFQMLSYNWDAHTRQEAKMSLKIAYTNIANLLNRRYPDGQTLMRKRTLRHTAKLFKVGSEVTVHCRPATVIAYNIAEFGRWISTSHPVLVRLHSGELQYCRLTDLQHTEKQTEPAH